MYIFLQHDYSIPHKVNTNQFNKLILPAEFNSLKAIGENALAYVAGHIIQTMKLGKCETCNHNLNSHGKEENFHAFIMEKELGGAVLKRLKYCNKDLFANFVQMYNIITYVLKNYIVQENLLENIAHILDTAVNFNFIKCEHSDSLVKLITVNFTKLLIYNYVKGVNNIISGRERRTLPHYSSELYKQAFCIFGKIKK